MTVTDTDSRHPLLRQLSLFLFGMVLLLAAVAWYLQTRHAFRHIIVPLVSAVAPGELRVDDGALTFPSTLELAGLSYIRPETGLSLQIDQLHVRISVMAWLREHLILMEELDLKNGQLHITSERPPSTQQGEPAHASTDKTALMVPFAIQRARLENITLSIQAGSDEFTVRNMTVAINDVGPGRTGTINLSSEMALTHAASQTRWAATFLLTGGLEESSDGRQVRWNVSNTLTVREWPGHVAVADSRAMTLDQTMSGHYDWTQATLRADSSLMFRQGEASLGDASLQFSQTQSPDGTVMDVGVKIQEVTDAAINLLLGNDESLRLRSAHMSGEVHIHGRGERYDVRSTFTGQKLQAVSGENRTPPLDVDVAQTGAFDLASHNVTLDIFELRVAEGDHVRLAGELNHSVTINLDTDGAEHTGVSTQNAPQADWMLTVTDIGVAELRQWGDVFHWKALRGIRTGQLEGIVTASSLDKGNAIDLNASLTISNMRMASPDKRTDRPPFTFAHEIHATVSNLTLFHLHSWIMTASVRDRSVGAARLAGAMNLKAPTRDPRLEGSITLTNLPGDACNPLLALWSDARIDRALFNGTATIKTTGDLISWEIDLRGNRVSLRLPKLHHATAPLDLVVAQSGSFNRTTNVLQFDKGMLQERGRSRSVITAAWDTPVRFALSGTRTDEKTRQSPGGQVDAVSVEAHHVEVGQLRAQLAVWNISALDGVKTGIIDGRWIIQWQGGTGILSVRGTLDVADLRLDAGAMHISAPLTLRSRTDATIAEFSRIRLEVLSIKALAGTNLIAEAGLTGLTNVDDGSMDFALTFNTSNMARLLDRIGLLDERQRQLFTRGSLSADGRVISRGQQHPLSAEATIRAREFRFQPRQGQFLTYSFLTQGTGELNAARTGIALNRIGMTLESHGKAAGTLTLAGTWPIAPPEQGGAMTVVTKDLDAAPLVDLFGLFPGREQGPLPVNADIAITRDSTTGMLAVQGQEILGPIRLARNKTYEGPNEATLHLTHDVSRQQDDIRATALTLTADRPGGQSDRVTVSGLVRIAGPPGAQLRGEIASLDAGWYAALFSKPEPRPQTSTSQAPEKDRGRRQKQSNSLALLTNLDAELSIGSVSYRTLMIGPGRLLAKGTGAQLVAKLEPTGMAEGRVEATVTLVRENSQAQLTWSGKGQGLHVDTLMQTIEPGREARLKGTGSFSTSGTGLLNEDPMRKHVTGIMNVSIANGQFMRAPLLEFLSTYTHIKELAQMGFDELQGNVRLEKQWIHVESIAVTGSLANLNGNVSFSPDDTVDGRIFVKVGPSLGEKIRIPCMSALLKTPDGFTALPFAVRIKGSTEHPILSADTASWNYVTGGLTSLADPMKHLLRGCREDRSEGRAQ